MPVNYTNKYVNFSNIKILRKLLAFPLAGIAVHWSFQGMLYMDRTERIFKLGLDFGLTLMIGMLLATWMPWPIALLLAFIMSHTINFLFNAQLWVVLKNYGGVNQSYEEFEMYDKLIGERIKTEPSITSAAVYGSRVRSAWRPSSDLDIRLIRRPGWINGLRACLFVLTERTRAFHNKFPLDIYVLDSIEPLGRLRADEEPLIICDKDGLLNEYYQSIKSMLSPK